MIQESPTPKSHSVTSVNAVPFADHAAKVHCAHAVCGNAHKLRQSAPLRLDREGRGFIVFLGGTAENASMWTNLISSQ